MSDELPTGPAKPTGPHREPPEDDYLPEGFLPDQRSAVQRALEAREDEAEENAALEWGVPTAILIVFGLAAMTIVFSVAGFPKGIGVWIGMVLAQVILASPLLFVFAIMLGNWFETELAPIHKMGFQVLCLSLGPIALADAMLTWALTTSFSITWMLICYAYYVMFAGFPAKYFFGLDINGAATLMGFVYLPRVVLLMAAYMLMPDLFAS